MTDPIRVTELLRGSNPVPDAHTAFAVVRRTDPLWQTIRTRLTEVDDAIELPRVARTAGKDSTMETATRELKREPGRRPRRVGSPRRYAALVGAGAVLAVIVFAALLNAGTGLAPDTVEPAAPGAEQSLHFTFTGSPNDDGCQYSGPATLTEGEQRTTFINDSGLEPVTVTLGKIAEGSTYQDFLDLIGAEEGNYPVSVPSNLHVASAHPWADGAFKDIHDTDWGPHPLIHLFDRGRYAIWCWRPGGQVWPGGQLEVAAQP